MSNNFINPNSNDKLSSLNKKDLEEFIKFLLQYKLKLRGNIGINTGYTFGLELEFENIKDEISDFENEFRHLKLNNGNIREAYHDTDLWDIKTDTTLTENNGREITSPIETDNIKTWEDLKKVCSFIKRYASVGPHSAGHIHIGSQALGDSKTALLNLLKLWAVYENVLYRYGYNEFLSKNPLIKYSKPSSHDYNEIYNKLVNDMSISVENILQLLTGRMKAISFSTTTLVSDEEKIAYKDTIEFRSPNGTLDPVIWQNNVNTFIKLLKCAKESKFDMDTIIKRERKTNKIEQDNYNQIFIDEALELADLIFDNNLDKLYFLRQYIKDNTVSSKPMQRSRKWTI